jgi:hypothetical protein
VIKKLNFFKETSIAPLVIFRIIFGAMMLLGTLRFLAKGWVNDLYIQPQTFFGYLGFEWVKPLQGNWMYLPFILVIISSLGVILGYLYKYSAPLLFLSFSYIELLDKSNYLNHYYFLSLMTFLLIFVPANRSFSLDILFKRNTEQKTVPIWTIGIFKFQLAIVYIFAGIAKLEADWLLNAQPLKIWLQAHREMPIFGTFLKEEWVAYLFCWFGCIYDLFIVFFLLSKKTRSIAYLFVVVFHFVTWFLLPIGIFPWVMIVSTLIFFSSEFHENLLIKFKWKKSTDETIKTNKTGNKIVQVLIISYVLFQLFIPFRYVLYPGNLFWNEEGFRFSWRVMLMHKEGTATFYVRDSETKREIQVRNNEFLSKTQEDQMSTQPDMILQYAQFLKEKFSDSTFIINNQTYKIQNPTIHATIYVSINGRISQLFIDKKHDLSKIPYNLAHRNWIETFDSK